MKVLIIFLICVQAKATEVAMWVTGAGGNVPPATVVTAKLVFTGADKPTVRVNGAQVTPFNWPYEFTYTSSSAGLQNTIEVTYCDYLGKTRVDTFTTTSGGRIFPKQLFR
jgi:hypothetical protein